MDVEFESLKNKKLLQVNEILQKRYGKTVGFLTLHVVGDYRDDEGQGYRIKDQKAFFQISYNDVQYLGAMTMTDCQGMTTEDFVGINELINLMMGPVLYKQYINSREQSMGVISQAHENEFEGVSYLETEALGCLQPLSHQVHFFSTSSTKSQRAAIELHHLLGYGSFVHFQSLQSEIHRAQELIELGKMTLFVQELHLLPLKVVDILVDYALLTRKFEYKETPILVTASVYNKEFYLKESKMSERQIDILMQFEVLLDRLSSSPHLFKESLELLLIK